MNALRRVLTFAALLVATAAAAWYGWREWDAHADVETTQDAYVRGEITVLSPRVAGYVTAVLADDDQRIEAGQVLMRLDRRDFQASVNRARASVEQVQAQKGQAEARLALQQRQIEVARATLEAAEAQARNSDTALGRARELLSRGVGTRAAFDNATAANASAHSAVDQARAQLAYQTQNLGVLDADIHVAQTRVDDAQAQLVSTRIALEDTTLWSPITGSIANRRTKVGEYVTIGTHLLSIVPHEGLWIEANFRETQIARMRPDQAVAITLDTYASRRICGYVEAVASAAGSEFALVPADNATGNFTKIVRRFAVRLRPARSDPGRALLRPGMSARVRVAVDGGTIEDCRFDAARDREPVALPTLPKLPGLGLIDVEKGVQP